MNAYLVRIPEVRGDFPSPCSLEPPEPWWPIGVFVAATAGQAKHDALREWSSSIRSGVYSDDYTNLRARLLERDLPDCVGRGELPDPSPLSDRLWWRASELLGEPAAEAVA